MWVSQPSLPSGLHLCMLKQTATHNKELMLVVMDPRPQRHLTQQRSIYYQHWIIFAKAGNQIHTSVIWADVETVYARILQWHLLEVFLRIRPEEYAITKETNSNELELLVNPVMIEEIWAALNIECRWLSHNCVLPGSKLCGLSMLKCIGLNALGLY